MINTIVLLLYCLASSTASNGFTYIFPEKNRHLDAHLQFYSGITQSLINGKSFNAVFDEAANDWEATSPVSIDVISRYVNPCAEDDVDTISLIGTSCTGHQFGNRLAFTLHAGGNDWTTGKPIIGDTEIFFDGTVNWGLYSGRYRWQSPDFRRAALHEIGHALGLGHSILDGPIMFSNTSDTDRLTPDDICGVAILYDEPERCKMLLGGATSTTGIPSSAIFTGGVTANKGLTYRTVFHPSETLDVFSTIVVEDEHIGQPGKLYAVFVLDDGAMYAKIMAGEIVPISGDFSELPAAASLTFAGANEMLIMSDMMFKNIDITELNVLIYVAYSVDSDPGRIIYPTTPMQLSIDSS